MVHAEAFDALLNDDETARFINVKRGSLRAMRARGSGPPFIRVGPRTPRYRRADLVAWLEARIVTGSVKPCIVTGSVKP